MWQYWEPGNRRVPATQAGWMRRPDIDAGHGWWTWETPDGKLLSAPANKIPVIWRAQ
jgi:hypothetical protein